MQYFAQLLEALNEADFKVQPIMYTEQGVGHASSTMESQTLTPEQKELVAGQMIYDEGGDDIYLNDEARSYGFTNSERGIAGHGGSAHWDSYWCKVLGFTATRGNWYTVWGRYGGYVKLDSSEGTVPFRASLKEDGVDLSIRYRFERSNDSCTITVVADGNEVISWMERDATSWTTIEKPGLAINRNADIEIQLQKGTHKLQADWIQLNEAQSVATSPRGKRAEAGGLQLSFKNGSVSLDLSAIDRTKAVTFSVNDLRGRTIQRDLLPNTAAVGKLPFFRLTPGLYSATMQQGTRMVSGRFLIR